MNLSILKNKNYLLVMMGGFVSAFGTYMQSFALSLYVLEKTGSAALFSTVIVASAIPRIILMPFAGVLADKFSRKRMIVLLDMLSGLFVLGIAAVLMIKGELSLGLIYAIVLVLNTISVFFEPSHNAMLPDIVGKDKLVDANSLIQIASATIMITAPITAGVLYSSLGIFLILAVNAVSFLFSAVSEMFIKIKKESLIAKEDHESFLKSFKAGLSYIKGMPEFLIVIGVSVIANFAISPIFSIALPIVVLRDFGMSEAAYGVITSLMMIGMFIGPLFASGIIKKYHYSKLVSAILSFAGILTFLIAVFSINGIFPNVYYNAVIIVILINILMVTIVWVNLGMTTARQKMVPGHLMGRVFSVMGMFSMAAMPLGQALMGGLLDSGKSYIIIGSFALVVLLSGILAKIGFANLERKGKMYKEPEENTDAPTGEAIENRA